MILSNREAGVPSPKILMASDADEYFRHPFWDYTHNLRPWFSVRFLMYKLRLMHQDTVQVTAKQNPIQFISFIGLFIFNTNNTSHHLVNNI